MLDGPSPLPRAATPLELIEGAFDWWREAGVDCAFEDAPHGWFEAVPEPEAVTAPPPPPAPPPRTSAAERAVAGLREEARIGGDPAALPETLDTFRQWWMTEPSLAAGALDRRIPPRGSAGAKALILLPTPFREDREGLADGAPGQFLAAILRAMGVAPHEAYLASALPAPDALPEWDALARRGLGAVLYRHLALAAPERVIVFGRALAPLLDIAAEAARAPFTIAAGGRTLPVLAAPELAELARAPARRQRFWNTWLEWTR